MAALVPRAAGRGRPTMAAMTADPPILATFADLDDAESALDWIGVDFVDGDDAFDGELDPDDAELLDGALADADAPDAVRALAAALRDRLVASPGAATWRVTFGV
jgi:hypothetical protein